MSSNPNTDSSIAETPYGRLIGYEVQDSTGNKIGTVHGLWIESTDEPLFITVKTSWFFGKQHIVPVANAEVNDSRELVRLPFTEEQVKNAPSFEEDSDLQTSDQDRLFAYYAAPRSLVEQVDSVRAERMDPVGSTESVTAENKTIQLKEEEVKIGKRQVEAGGIRLRKIVRTETVNQPVELQREEIVIERVPASGQGAAGEQFGEEDIFIPLRREEAVVEKTAHVHEEVRVGKKTEVDRRTITEQVRKEDLQVEEKPAAKTPRK